MESTIRVLIADDHTIVREGLRAVLGSEPDMEVVGEAATGREVVELATEVRPDAILMDIQMPSVRSVFNERSSPSKHSVACVIARHLYHHAALACSNQGCRFGG